MTSLQTVSLHGEAEPGRWPTLTKPLESEIWSGRVALGPFLILQITPISFYFSSLFILLYMQGKDSHSFLPVRNHFLLITSATINIHHIFYLFLCACECVYVSPTQQLPKHIGFRYFIFIFMCTRMYLCVWLMWPMQVRKEHRVHFRRLWATQGGKPKSAGRAASVMTN